MSPRRKALLAIAALLFSGLAQPIMSAPLNLYWLHPWVLAPGFYVLSRLQGKRAFLAGWFMGLAANLGIFYWVAETVAVFAQLPYIVGVLALLLLALFVSLYLGVFAWGLSYIRSMSGMAWPFAGAAWFVTCEFLNPQLFPYYHGMSLYQVPELFLVTSVTGVPGLSFQMIFFNLLLVAVVEQVRGIGHLSRRAWVGSAAAIVLMVGADLGISARQEARIRAAEAEAESLRIAIVQPNLGVFERRELGAARVAHEHVKRSVEALTRDPEIDVFVFAEGGLRSTPTDPDNRQVFDFIDAAQREVWTGARGAEEVDGEVRRYNSGYLLHRDGTIGRRYDKIKLLAFGEYPPFEDVLPFMGHLPGVGHFSAGTEVVLLDSETPAHGAFLICYEAILREFARTQLPEETDLIVNITYDAWFGDTTNPPQHLMMAAARSAELGIPMVRAATTGISAFVDARGVITEQTRAFTDETLVADVRPLRVPTFYGAVGDWLPWSATVVSLSLLVWGFVRSRRATDS